MDQQHPLNLNLLKVARCLSQVLRPRDIDKIKHELKQNVRQALRLAEAHLRFARSAAGNAGWRQKVSRAYYCCYCASRAVRLSKTGVFSTQVDDHKKVGDLPDAFEDRLVWADILTKFRADRNLADYDHTVSSSALEYPPDDYVAHAAEFLKQAKKFLRSEGSL
jgi:uncharacterized protein (UPF0332 family)